MKITVLDKNAMGEDTPFSLLEKLGDISYFENTTPDKTAEHIADAEIIILNKVKITEEAMTKSPNLKLICVFATGYDNIDTAAAKRLGIGVCNVPGYSTDSVALFTLATVLALTTKLFEYNNFVKSGEYTREKNANKITPVFHVLKEKTWGIIGYGAIGKAVAEIARSFGVRVLAVKRTPTEEVECVDIDTLCKTSDIITVHCPLNNETRELINRERIELMKESVIIVNEARGAVLNEADIVDAIKRRRIAGFGCDVYSNEPFDENHPYNDIKNLPNVLLTPHAAWGAYEAREKCISIIYDNITSYMHGMRLNRIV